MPLSAAISAVLKTSLFRSYTMKKILALAIAVFAFNVVAAAPPADPKPADKSAHKDHKKADKDAAKADAGTAM